MPRATTPPGPIPAPSAETGWQRATDSRVGLVLLGCRLTPAGLPSPAAARRVARCLAAYHQIAPAVVLVSGGKRWSGTAEAVGLGHALCAEGLPRDRLVLETRSQSTFENALYSTPMLRSLGVERLGLVTCDYHMPRAARLFTWYGFRPLELAARTPRASRRTLLSRSCSEWAKGQLDRSRRWRRSWA